MGGVIYVPSTPIPVTEEGLEEAYWYATWDRPVGLLDVLSLGSTVYLYDADWDVLRWETEVVDVIARPYEHLDQFRSLLSERWGLPASEVVGTATAPGWGIAFKVRPVARLDRAKPTGVAPLEAWETTWHMDGEVQRAWGLVAEACPYCAVASGPPA